MSDLRVPISDKEDEEIKAFVEKHGLRTKANFIRIAYKIVMARPELLVGEYLPLTKPIEENTRLKALETQMENMSKNIQGLIVALKKDQKTIDPSEYL